MLIFTVNLLLYMLCGIRYNGGRARSPQSRKVLGSLVGSLCSGGFPLSTQITQHTLGSISTPTGPRCGRTSKWCVCLCVCPVIIWWPVRVLSRPLWPPSFPLMPLHNEAPMSDYVNVSVNSYLESIHIYLHKFRLFCVLFLLHSMACKPRQLKQDKSAPLLVPPHP